MDLAETVRHRISETGSNLRTVLGIYMTWYTFYWVLNGTVLAWHFSRNQPTSMSGVVGWFFVIMAAPSALSSFLVAAHGVSAANRLTRLSRVLAELLPPAQKEYREVLLEKLFSRRLILWGLSVNGIATAALPLIWLHAMGVLP